MRRRAPTAAGIIIGNEILAGKVQDSNSHCLAGVLRSRGVRLARVEVVPDEEGEIAESIHRIRAAGINYIFTSGGIGPTHDDITYQAVAHAYGLAIKVHEPTFSKMQESMEKRNIRVTEERKRMACLPEESEVLETPGLWVPLCVVKRECYILPGIPPLFERMLTENATRLPFGDTIHHDEVSTHLKEGEIAAALRHIAEKEKYQHAVALGSYPVWDRKQREYKGNVEITMESSDFHVLSECKKEILAALEGLPGPKR